MIGAGSGVLIALLASPASEDTFRTSDGVGLHYRSVGGGPETVVIPVAALASPDFDRLADGRRVVYYDPRGRGRSERGPLESVSFERASRDLEELRVHLGLERFAVVGFSGYGMEMALYALEYPGRVSRLVQLAPVPPRFEPWGERGMAAREPRIDPERMREFEQLAERGAPGEAQCRALEKALLPAMTVRPESFAEEDFDHCGNPNEWPENTREFFGRLFPSLLELDLGPRLGELDFPRLVMHAAEDTFPLEGSQEWVRGHEQARLLVIADAGHLAWHDQPEMVFGAIERFLSGEWPEGSAALAAAAR